MTKEQKADALLCAAKKWQNEDTHVIVTFFGELGVLVLDLYSPHGEMFDLFEAQMESSSAALSEVAALGFDIVDAATGE